MDHLLRAQRALARAIEIVGGSQGDLARALTAHGNPITSQAIQQWKNARVPASRAREVFEVTGVPLHELRPDYWPPPSSARRRRGVIADGLEIAKRDL